MDKFLRLVNSAGVKIVSFIVLISTTYTLGTDTQSGILKAVLIILDSVSFISVATVLFTLDMEKITERKNSDKAFYQELIAQLPYDETFRLWFSEFDHGNSFDDRYLSRLYGVNDSLLTNEIKCFHNKEINVEYSKLREAVADYLVKMSSHTSSSGHNRGRVYPLEENNSDIFWRNVRELNEAATSVFTVCKDFHLKVKDELHI